jgi:hypothetical protein
VFRRKVIEIYLLAFLEKRKLDLPHSINPEIYCIGSNVDVQKSSDDKIDRLRRIEVVLDMVSPKRVKIRNKRT